MIIPSNTSSNSAAAAVASSLSAAASSSSSSSSLPSNSLASLASSTQIYRNKKLLALVATLSGLSAAAAALWILQRHYYRKTRKQICPPTPKTMAGEHSMSTTSSSTNRSAGSTSMKEESEISNLEDCPLISCSFERKPSTNTNEMNGFKDASTTRSTDTNGEAIPWSEYTLHTAQPTIQSASSSTNDEKNTTSFQHRPSFNWVDEVDQEMERNNRTNSIKDNQQQQQKNTFTGGSNTERRSSTSVTQTAKAFRNGVKISTNHQYHNHQNIQHNANQTQDYKNAESPNSTNSEGSADSGSQDSGRATGGLTSTSPFDLNEMEVPICMYEFEIPNTLVGLIIGVGGKTIQELCKRAEVKMLIRPHHTPIKIDSHQICSVEGKRENINKCLHMIKGRFPKERFPDLNLKPVLPPPINNPSAITQARPQPTPLTMPSGVPCEVYISASVDAGHFFVQLPTHPSFPSLQLLDYYMLSVYSQVSGVPELPKPCNVGVLCAAPAYNGWFRAITLLYDEEQDETLVRFVDYGGFAKIPRADLRQIRTDFMTLPLQAIECYLANVQPVDGTSHWSEEATELFQKLCAAKIIQAELVGTNKSDGIPCVDLYIVDENKKVLRIDNVLLERGLAKPADPTRIVRLQSKMPLAAINNNQRSVKDAVKTN
uniref:Tudor domain-containing protein n=1 Tax=Ditylenchus dipsaci TaxID=166011 RepID=A0A915CUE4_9BILA